jgi:hypothetical protein
MAEEKKQLYGIDWQQTFAFTNVFRSFRLAIHPSKLVLAFLGLAICFVAGLVLDRIWYAGPAIIWENGQPAEVQVFADGGYRNQDFGAWYESASDSRQGKLKRMRKELGAEVEEISVNSAGLASRLIEAKKEKLENYLADNSLEKRIAAVRERYDDQSKRAKRIKELKEEVPQRLQAERRAVQAKIEDIRDLVGKGPARRGPFSALLKYEQGVFNDLVRDVRVMAPFNLLGGAEAAGGAARVGVIGQLWRALKGIQWLLVQHCVFFILFGAICLAIWAIFGGAISRIAALHVARDEKISIKEALKFGLKKFPSFLFAPLIPVAIVGVLTFLVWIGSLILFNWGLGIGEVLNSLLYCLPLIAGFVMALVAVGTVGGLTLMFPTIAVEGSDSFDAISRSFSYVYARPWRMAFYSLVALIYGVFCYLFVRFFAFLMLKLSYQAVDWAVLADGNSGLMSKFNTMWSGPTFENLHGGFDWSVCWGVQAFGAWIIAFWVYVVIGFVIAFLVSFFFSANTVIYYLLRNRVDATDMDDVYVEEEPAEEVPPVSEEPAKDEEKAEEPESKESDEEQK